MYKTHGDKFLRIIETLKTWQHYLKDYKYKTLVFINYNNFCQFIDIKSLSLYQIY